LSTITDALSTLSDRGLRRLLGARTFLRGLDYEKRKVVEQISIDETQATCTVKGSDANAYDVIIRLGGEGITSSCSCPAFSKTGQHCKHVAGLLINLRNKSRTKGLRPAAPAPAPAPAPASASASASNRLDQSKASRRRERRRRNQTQQTAVPPGLRPPPSIDATARPTGIGAWMSPPDSLRRLDLEFRVHVRTGGLTVTVLDTEARVPLLPSVALSWQTMAPSHDRAPLRVLARHESGNPRHPAVDVRGEDVAELLPYLAGRRVLLEPALMQLRFSEEVLKPRFDLEMVGADTIVAKCTFERENGNRAFQLTNGGWFEGWPGWHIDTNEGIARPIDKVVSPAALRRLLNNPTIAEPAAELISVITNDLPRVALEMGAQLPELSQVADVIDITPSFIFRAGGSIAEANATLSAKYGNLEIEVRADGISPPIIVQAPEEGQKRARCIRPDIVAQQKAVQLLLEHGLDPSEEGDRFIATGGESIRFWSEGVAALPRNWEMYIPDDLVGAKMRGAPIAMKARVSSGVDWLNVNISWEADGVSVERDEIQRCLREGKKFIRLSDNSYAALDSTRIQALIDREVEILASAGKQGKLPLSQAGRVQELLEQADERNVATATKALFKKLASLDEIKKARKPRGLKATLRPYQEQGLSWLRFIHDIGSGGVLADDMGLGKTVQTIALLLSLNSGKDTGPVKALIVAPTSVVSNWVREIERFGPSLKVALWHGANRKEQEGDLENAHVIVTSYALLRRDLPMLGGIKFDYAILDEAQAIKNPSSATAAAAKELNTRHRLALTGTPIENRLSEIWSIFDFVSPGLLGPLAKFEERYARPIDQGDSKQAAKLRAVIHPFILRRTKREVAKDLPEKLEFNQIVDMAPEQRAVYLQVLREVRAQVLGEVERVGVAKSQLHILAGLTKLRQAACDPRLLGLPKELGPEDSGKLSALRELVREVEEGGHKVLIFSQFVSMLKLVAAALDQDKIRYEYLDGSTTDRPERIDRFQEDPTIPVFLISLKAGGIGLNLTAADTVIHFDPWWNPAVEDQATDRAHRIGQDKVVSVYRLVAAGTIEEKILQLKQKKKDLVASVLEEDHGGGKSLTKTDLEDLFNID
jgi:superfamily II DNA or RNA helicase